MSSVSLYGLEIARIFSLPAIHETARRVVKVGYQLASVGVSRFGKGVVDPTQNNVLDTTFTKLDTHVGKAKRGG